MNLLRTIIFIVSVSLICFSSLNAQNNTTTGKKTPPKTDSVSFKQSFTERYFEIRDSYPALTAIHADYAAAAYTKEEFMKRYYEMQAVYPKFTWAFGDYARSEYTLDEFIKRYYRMKDPYKAK